MTTITTKNGDRYGVEFRHRTRKLSPQQKRAPGFSAKAPIKGLTTCVIVKDAEGCDGVGAIGVGTAICVRGDNFSRREGMERAFARAALDCKLWDAAALMEAYAEQWPPRLPWNWKPERTELPEDVKQRMIEDGAEKRDRRAAQRTKKAGG